MNADPKNWSSLIGAPPDAREKTASEFVDAQVLMAAPKRMMAMMADIMATSSSSEEKLNEIVALVSHELRADACSCFILRPGDLLELFSAVGLSMDITRRGKIRVGEGVVGDIASHALPVIIPDLSIHEARPETGDNTYKALCGVPVLRGGRVRGVLVIQNKLPRHYGEEITEILQTVAMILAELIIAGGIITRLEMSAGFASGDKPNQVEGLSLSRGLAIGTAVVYEPGIAMRDIVSNDSKAEKTRLKLALSSMHEAIDKILSKNENLAENESRDILEAYQMFARDRGWLARIDTAIDKGLSAEAAVTAVQNENRARMMQMNDAYLRERLQDLEDLSNRLLSHLVRKSGAIDNNVASDNIILVAKSLGPAALLDYDHKKLKAVVLENGTASNHVAIVARALGIPVVGQCGDVSNFISSGDQVIVDGDHGMVYIRPSEYVIDLYTKSIEARVKRSTLFRRQVQQQSVTKDGIPVTVMMNAGLMVEIDSVAAVGADGIGLFRSELSFMAWQKYPLVVTQAELYGKIMDKMGDKTVTFRTLDIGGDKPLPYFKAPDEDNPALGWRAVRIGMDRPAVLRTQFRAFIRGARGRNLKIMIPFVSEVAEFVRVKELLEMEKKRARDAGLFVPEKIELGVMLEVPALLWQMDALLKVVDFVSVGSNDLMQYIFAADRGSSVLRGRYDCLSPAMLTVLKTIADKCNAAKIPVSVCGEMAGTPLEAMVLIALGFNTLSMAAQSVEQVKMMVPSLDASVLKPYLDDLMVSGEHSLRERLMSFARDHNVNILQTV